MGTLTGVEITLADSTTGGSAFASVTGGEGSATASLSGALDITAPGGATPFTEPTSVFATCDAASNNACQDGPNAQDDPTFTPNPVTDTTDLAAFMGLGMVNLNANIASVINGSHSSGSGTIITTEDLTWNGNVSVSYQYTPDSTGVPEPASLTLFGMGIAGLGFMRRQRKR